MNTWTFVAYMLIGAAAGTFLRAAGFDGAMLVLLTFCVTAGICLLIEEE